MYCKSGSQSKWGSDFSMKFVNNYFLFFHEFPFSKISLQIKKIKVCKPGSSVK